MMRIGLTVTAVVLAMWFVRDARAECISSTGTRMCGITVGGEGSYNPLPSQLADPRLVKVENTLDLLVARLSLEKAQCQAKGGNINPDAPGCVFKGKMSLVTQTYAGRISITHDLTKDECEAKRHEALSIPHTSEERAAYAELKEMRRCKPDPQMPHMCDSSPFTIGLDHPEFVYTASDVKYAECLDKPLP